jgi:hypothetical protein
MKVKEIVYMVLDLAKAATSDDSYFTEDHALFLCRKYRAFLIKKEQEKKAAVEQADVFEQQQICLDLEKVAAIDGSPCTGGYYLRTTKAIPKIVEGTVPQVYPVDYYQGTNISYISIDRMRYVGTNKYLQNIIYASIAPDFHIYLKSSNPQFMYLKKLRMAATFEDFDSDGIKDLLCDDNGESQSCDPMEMTFPIREYLVPTLIELVVKELTGAAYIVSDEKNNSSDDLPKIVNGK